MGTRGQGDDAVEGKGAWSETCRRGLDQVHWATSVSYLGAVTDVLFLMVVAMDVL